jgi:predicted DsbA family dithiol-disulfide isomerase
MAPAPPGASGPTEATFPVDFVGDVVCPWCYLGWTRLTAALATRPELGAQVVWRPFQLQFGIPDEGLPYAAFMASLFPDADRRRQMDQHLAALGAAEGLDFRFGRIAVRPNTNAAHRVIRWAGLSGGGLAQAIMRAHFSEGRNIGVPEALAGIVTEAGLDLGDVAARLRSDQDRQAVEQDCVAASRAGISGVPFMIFAGRTALSGAESPERILYAIDKALEPPAP